MANKLKNTQKKSIARELYLHGDFTFEEIAAKVDAARQTVSRWAKEDNWPDLKASMTVGKEYTLKSMPDSPDKRLCHQGRCKDRKQAGHHADGKARDCRGGTEFSHNTG